MAVRNTRSINRKEPIRKWKCTTGSIFMSWLNSDNKLTEFEVEFDPLNKIFDLKVKLEPEGTDRLFDFIVFMTRLGVENGH